MVLYQKTKIFFYAIGNIIPRIISLILISICSFFLSKAEIGIYDLLLNAISLLMPIILLQLGEACYRWAYGQFDYKVNDLIKTVLLFLLFADTFLLILFKFVIFYFQFKVETSFLYVIFSTALFTLFQTIARTLNLTKAYALSGILNSVVIILLVSAFFYMGYKNIHSIILSYIFANILSIFYLLFYLNLKQILINGIYKQLLLNELLKYALPLIPTAISWWIVYFANQYIILCSLGIEANGTYAVAARIPSLLLLVNHIFLMIFQDAVFAETPNHSNIELHVQRFQQLFTFQTTLAMVLIACLKRITAFFFANIYVESYKISALFLIGVLFTNFANFFVTFYLIDKNSMSFLKTMFLCAFINIAFTYCTIPTLGLYGAVFGTMFSFGVLWYLGYLYVKKQLHIQLDCKLMLTVSVLLLLVLCSIYVSSIYLEVVSIIASLFLFYFYNQLIINKIYAKFR
jgi:O-antigen/teichoic acid export membrane protein